jgi:hypothetical protein
MAKFMCLWHGNPGAPWPTELDVAEDKKFNDMLWAVIDNWLKTGEMLEFGFFPDGKSGYAIVTGDSKDVLRLAMLWYFPFIELEVHEIVLYETGKEIMDRVYKEYGEAMAAIKQ